MLINHLFPTKYTEDDKMYNNKKYSRGLNIFVKCCYEESFILTTAILKSCLCLTQDLLNTTIRWHLTRSRSFVVLREQGGIWGDWPRYCGRSLTHLKVQKLLSRYIGYKQFQIRNNQNWKHKSTTTDISFISMI